MIFFLENKYLHRYDTNLGEVFNENKQLELITNDEFVSKSLEELSQKNIKEKFKKLNVEKRDISYGESEKIKIITYGDKNNLFRYVVSGEKEKSFPIYAKITSKEISLDDIKVGDSYEDLKNKFHIQDTKVHNFRVSPLDGGLFFEFYFNENGELEKIIFRDTYTH